MPQNASPRVFRNLLFQIPRHKFSILLLQLRLPPILARDDLPAIGRSTMAFHLIIVVIRHRPIVGQFFSGFYVAHRNKHDLTANTNIRIARVIAPDHAATVLLLSHGTDEKTIGNRNLGRSKKSVQISEIVAGEDVSALDADNFTLTDRRDGEQTLAVDGTRLDGSFAGQI